MDGVQSLGPQVDERTRVLVLGTMPGVVSLELQQYYAHKRNRFWRLMEVLVGMPTNASYEQRVERLLDVGIGLWDTLKTCDRPGSLDANIRNGEPNDVRGLLAAKPSVSVVALNGNTAAALFTRMILPTLPKLTRKGLTVLELPSTSAANARGGFEALLEKWRVLNRYVDASAVNAV